VGDGDVDEDAAVGVVEVDLGAYHRQGGEVQAAR
jgi:hypothetical protein